MRRPAAIAVLALAAVLAGCATVPAAPGAASAAKAAPVNKADPWEAWNRKVFAFNDAVDNAVLKPVAEGYRKVVPELVRKGVGNFFGNLTDVWSTVNHFLQGKFDSGFEMGFRVLTNSTMGLFGVLDPATEMHLERRSEDFGQTLGRWGVPPGPYVVLPFLGPSSARDASGLTLDIGVGSPARVADTNSGTFELTALQFVQTRSELLATTRLLGDIALDRYSFVRDAYLQRRLDQVYDGAPPLENLDDVPDDKPAAAAAPAAASGPASAPAR